MKKSLYNEIEDALNQRKQWETRQSMLYQMRNGGLRRQTKPYQGAPDMHYPLVDGLIEKLKPLYVQQMYGGETVASFISLRQQDSDVTSAAAYWFDYQLKQRSNFERTMFMVIDEMLQDGFCPCKVYWDFTLNQLAFDQVDPLHLITPTACQEFNQAGGADWLVHVLHMSVSEYKANKLFKQDEGYIKTITGRGDERHSGDAFKRQFEGMREGINYSNRDNEIVLWEVYNRNRKDGEIVIETISPLRPYDDQEGPVRSEFALPFNQGEFKGGETFPFFKLRAELKSKGHYSSRGIGEINAPFEASLCRSWNTWHEWQDFFGRPQFSSDRPIPNAANYKTRPGGILPPGLTPVTPPPVPSALRDDMEFTRALAEYRTQIPDLGASQHLDDKGAGGKVTATQINAIVGQSGQGNDMRARVFKLDLGEGLKLAWSLCQQYTVSNVDAQGQPDEKSLTYIVNNEINVLDQGAIHDDYEIVPNGSADSWNKGAQMQKRLSLMQVLKGNPYIGQDELTKWVLEGEDPRLVKLLYRDPGIQQQDQMEEQAIEISTMLLGFPAPVNPGDDDKSHLQCISQFIQRRVGQQEPVSPEVARLALQHIGEHGQALEQKKDPGAKQVEMQMLPVVQLLEQIAQSDQQGQAPGGNVIPMQQPSGGAGMTIPSPGQPPPGPLPPQGKQPAPPDPIADSAKLMAGLAALIKAGTPITHQEVNQVLAMAGLPPLAEGPTTQPQMLPEPFMPPAPPRQQQAGAQP